MKIKIREFEEKDIPEIIEILKLNNQYHYPKVDGPEAMKRVAKCESAIFLVAEDEKKVVGVVRGVYDGSRALIHQISVHPQRQREGIGSALIKEISKRFRDRGALSVSVTAYKGAMLDSTKFFEKLGFKELGAVSLMIAFDIERVIQRSDQVEGR